ncbi:MAG: hypothetical protein PGN25_09960 [Methylorubrum populi]
MNPHLIETREQALTLVEADLITIRDYLVLCGFKGWRANGDMTHPVSAHQAEPAGRDERPRDDVVEHCAMRQEMSAVRRPRSEVPCFEPDAPVRRPSFSPTITSA